MGFSLEQFEYLAYTRQHETAARELLDLLGRLDANYGLLGEEFQAVPQPGLLPEENDAHVMARLAGAISTLFADPGFQFTPEGFGRILHWHRWIAAIFGASPYGSADHVIRALNLRGHGDLREVEVANENLAKFCLMVTPESEVRIDWDAFWRHDRLLAVGLALVLLSTRLMAAPVAHARREALLPWLTRRLGEIESLVNLPVGILHDVYMGCSYADQAAKHEIKRPINALIRRRLHEVGLRSLHTPAWIEAGRRPVMLVVVEWFSVAHSIYRTHSRTLESARERFEVVGMGYPSTVDEAGRAVFDDFVELGAGDLLEQLAQIRAQAEARGAQILYMPSVGMFPLTMYLSNMRVAPIQAMALGHPATTLSDEIDYVVVERDYVGDPACFSEALMRLPPDGMPYRPSGLADPGIRAPEPRENPEVVEIAVASAPMKLNPRFLAACAQIAARARTPVRFRFLIGQAQGLTYAQVLRNVRKQVGPSAHVYPHQSYQHYMAAIAGADLFINPFPFGNTNGLVDTVTAGLVGICKTGPEVHEHIDQGLFQRLGLPEWMVASTVEQYVEAAVRLIDDHKLRAALRRELAGPAAADRLFHGRPAIMGQLLYRALELRVRREEGGTPALGEAPGAVGEAASRHA